MTYFLFSTILTVDWPTVAHLVEYLPKVLGGITPETCALGDTMVQMNGVEGLLVWASSQLYGWAADWSMLRRLFWRYHYGGRSGGMGQWYAAANTLLDCAERYSCNLAHIVGYR